MKKRNKLLFSLLYVIGMFIILFPNNSLSQSYNDDIEYTFNENNPYNDINNISITNYNLREKKVNTEFYNASYSFTNDTIGSNPIGFIIDETGGSVNVLNNLNGHDKIVMLNDSDIVDLVSISNIFSEYYGTVEYWFMISDAGNYGYMEFENQASDYSIFVRVKTDTFSYFTGGGWVDTTIPCIDNVWYHLRFDFECGGGGYLGLSADTYNWWIRGILIPDIPFQNVANTLENSQIYSRTNEQNYEIYLDAIGLNWLTNYTIDNNRYPIIESYSNIFVPDKYEFTLDSDGDPFIDNVQNPNYVGFDNTNGNNVYTDNIYIDEITESYIPFNEYGAKVFGHNVGGGAGIYNDTYELYQDNINVSFSLRYFDVSELTSWILLLIESLDSTTICSFRIETITANKATLQYYDGAYQDLDDIYGLNNPFNLFTFNLYIHNYSINLLYYMNNTYNNSYSFPLIENLKGLSKVELLAYDSNVNDFIVRFDDFGIYQYNISLCRELGYKSYYFGNEWNLRQQNLFYFNSTEYVRIIASNKIYLYRLGFPAFGKPIPLNLEIADFGNNKGYINTYEASIPYIFDNSSLILETSINGVNYSDIGFIIEGISLSDNSSTYFPSYSYNNVDKDFSYFYVRENILYHTLDITQNDIYENMTIYFDIDNINTVNRSYSFKSIYNGIGKSFCFINYTDNDIDIFSSFTRISSVNYILPQDKLINILAFMASDFNNSGYTNYTSIGQFYNLKFKYIENIEFTLITTLLINLIIPLIFIFVPTLSISARIGKSFIIPIFMFMLVIAFIGDLIPVWLLLITEISLITSFFIDKEGEL